MSAVLSVLAMSVRLPGAFIFGKLELFGEVSTATVDPTVSADIDADESISGPGSGKNKDC